MKMHTKSVMVIAGTLVIGIILGALISGAIMRDHLKRFPRGPFPDRFVNTLERVIRPDDANRDTVRVVLDRYSERFDEIFRSQEEVVQPLIESLRVELDPILTTEQKDRLERHHQRMEKMFHRAGKRKGSRRFGHDFLTDSAGRPPWVGRGGLPDSLRQMLRDGREIPDSLLPPWFDRERMPDSLRRRMFERRHPIDSGS